MPDKLTEVEAVIAALKIALQDAERRNDLYTKVRAANRFIDQLPGSRRKWRRLKVGSDLDGYILRADFIGQVHTTIAYLETNKEVIASGAAESKSWLRFWRRKPKEAPVSLEPIDVEFTEAPKPGRKQKNALKVVDKS